MQGTMERVKERGSGPVAKKGEIKTNLDRQIDGQETFLAFQRDPDDDGGGGRFSFPGGRLCFQPRHRLRSTWSPETTVAGGAKKDAGHSLFRSARAEIEKDPK